MGAIFTEYNRSQRDIAILEAFATAGASLDLTAVRLLLRVGGGGAWFDDGRTEGPAHFFEVALELPLSERAAIRLAGRDINHAGPDGSDYSVLLVSSGGLPEAPRWDYGFSAGFSDPGRGLGKSLRLATAPFTRFSLHRRSRGTGERIGLTVVTSAHESEKRTDFNGVPGNQRGKNIEGVSLAWDRERTLAGASLLRYRLGAEVSDWHDEFSLLLDGDRAVRGGIDAAALAAVETVRPIAGRLRLLLGVEKLYWIGLGMGEVRFFLGAEISP